MSISKKTYSRPGRIRHYNPKPHRLAYRIAVRATVLVVVVTVLLQWLVWDWSWIGTGLIALGTYFSVYYTSVQNVARRLDFVRSALKRIRKHTFEHLELAENREGDELNDLIRQVYRTGKVVDREFEELTNLENYRRDFIGNVSHELKTPIFAIRGFAETLLDGALEDEEVRYVFVEKIVRNADRLASLAQDLSEISRLETGQRAMKIQPFDVGRWVADVVDTVDSLATSSQITITTSIQEDLPSAVGDALQLRQVLTNLVVNAVKYSNPGKKVQISIERTKRDTVQIAVIDQGIGIKKEHIGRLTERFFRVDKSRSRLGGGTGLGLAIVKHILAAHNQVLQIKSTPGKGSTFRFELPVAEDGSIEGSSPPNVQMSEM